MITYNDFIENFKRNSKQGLFDRYNDLLKYFYNNFIVNINNINSYICYGFIMEPAIMLVLYFNKNLKIVMNYHIMDFIENNNNVYFSISYNNEKLCSGEIDFNTLIDKINKISEITKMGDT